MSEIKENVVLEMNNLISYRGKVTQQQLQQITKEMNEIILANNAKKCGPSVSATFGVEMVNGAPLIDIEILIPIDKIIDVPSGYKFKPLFRLKNAVMISHHGNPAKLQNTVNELTKYISDNNYTPATAGYNVTVQEPTTPTDVEGFIVDVYVGVNDNIL